MNFEFEFTNNMKYADFNNYKDIVLFNTTNVVKTTTLEKFISNKRIADEIEEIEEANKQGKGLVNIYLDLDLSKEEKDHKLFLYLAETNYGLKLDDLPETKIVMIYFDEMTIACLKKQLLDKYYESMQTHIEVYTNLRKKQKDEEKERNKKEDIEMMIKEEENQKQKKDAKEKEEHARQYNPINIEVARQFASKIKNSLEQQEISKRFFEKKGEWIPEYNNSW
jgi:hypothetical protein